MASLIKHYKSGIYYIQYKGKNGKWQRKTTGTKFRDLAKDYLKKFQRAEDENKLGLLLKKPVTLSEAIEAHLKKAKAGTSPSWFKDKTNILKKIESFFGGNTLITQIDTKMVDDFIIWKSNNGEVSNTTINLSLTVLNTLLEFCIDRGDLDLSLKPKIKKLKAPKKPRVRFLDKFEITALREAARDHSDGMAIFVDLMIFSGLRSSEAQHLRWEDIFFDRRRIRISVQDDWQPKSGEEREIPMLKVLYQALKEQQQKYPDSKYVVVDKKMTQYRIKREFTDVVRAAGLQTEGIDKVVSHTCRHTFASMLVNKGEPIYMISAWLGHSEAKTTEIYMHLDKQYKSKVMMEIDFDFANGD